MHKSWNKLLKPFEDCSQINEPDDEAAKMFGLWQIGLFADCDKENMTKCLLIDFDNPRF